MTLHFLIQVLYVPVTNSPWRLWERQIAGSWNLCVTYFSFYSALKTFPSYTPFAVIWKKCKAYDERGKKNCLSLSIRQHDMAQLIAITEYKYSEKTMSEAKEINLWKA